MKKFVLLTLFIFTVLSGSSQKYELLSPDRKLTASIEINKGISVVLLKGDLTAIRLENIAIETENISQTAELKVQKATRNQVSEILKPQIREKAETYINSYNELEIRFKTNRAITFRLFNEGLAYRFSTSTKDSLTIYRENLKLILEPDDSARFQSSGTFNSCWETPYEHSKITGIESGKLCNLPFLVEKHNGQFVMISESDLYNYPGQWLRGTGQQNLSAVNPPYPKTLSYKGSIFEHGQVADVRDYIARVKGTRTYPWRIFSVADDEKALVANNIVYLLSSASVIDDVSWIKPGVVMFDWWAKSNIYGVDFKSGINTATAKYFIDFCAEHGFRYYMFDDGWCPEEDLLNPRPELNMAEVTAYAESKGSDGINAGTRAEDYRKVETTFQSGEVLKLKLASGGGWVAIIYTEK
jgi:alpha-glucosidase